MALGAREGSLGPDLSEFFGNFAQKTCFFYFEGP